MNLWQFTEAVIRHGRDQELADLGSPKPAVIYCSMNLKVVWLLCLHTPNNIDIFYGGFKYLHLCRNSLIKKDESWSNPKFQSDRALCQFRVILKYRATTMVLSLCKVHH